MDRKRSFVIVSITLLLISCGGKKQKNEIEMQFLDEKNFSYRAEQFADLQVLRYKVPGFEQLTPKQKELVYYLYQAALSGRDIIYY